VRPFFFPALLAVFLFSTALSGRMATIEIHPSKHLRAGESVNVTWPALPENTEEFELLLKVELPGSLTIRLTESRSPGLKSFTWLVPNVPCFSASLLLRKGESGEEETWGESAPFTIEYSRRTTLPMVVMKSGELWLTERSAPVMADDGGGRLQNLPASAPRAVMVNLYIAMRFSDGASNRESALNPEGDIRSTRLLSKRPLKLQLRI